MNQERAGRPRFFGPRAAPRGSRAAAAHPATGAVCPRRRVVAMRAVSQTHVRASRSAISLLFRGRGTGLRRRVQDGRDQEGLRQLHRDPPDRLGGVCDDGAVGAHQGTDELEHGTPLRLSPAPAPRPLPPPNPTRSTDIEARKSGEKCARPRATMCASSRSTVNASPRPREIYRHCGRPAVMSLTCGSSCR